MRLNFFIPIILAAVSTLPGLAESWAAPPAPKLIEFGWDAPTPAYLRENIRRMEADSPYDGIGFYFRVDVEHNDAPYQCNWLTAANPEVAWQDAWFQDAVTDLRKTEFRQFTDNFLMLAFYRKTDWFDDAAWATICGNFAVAARAVRAAGQKGIEIDTEHYDPQRRQFRFDPADGRSFAECYQKARQRGREWMQAVAEAYPDITLLAFFWQSANEWRDGSAALEQAEYGLKAAFINGIYEALPPEATIYEGNEEDGYRAATPEDYYRVRFEAQQGIEHLTEPENLRKARSQTRFAPALYLDAYFLQPPDNTWYLADGGKERLRQLEDNLRAALAVSDGYVWTWSERARWWDIAVEDWQKPLMTASGDALWFRAFPGIAEAMRNAKRSEAEVEFDRVRARGSANLAANGDFARPAAGAVIPEWIAWMDENTPGGSFVLVPDGNRMTAAARQVTGSGTLYQPIPVTPGRRYLVVGEIFTAGAVLAELNAHWMMPDGKWNWGKRGCKLTPPPGDGWRSCMAIVTAPEEVGFLGLQLHVSRQTGGEAAFRNIQVYQLEESTMK